MIYYFVTNLNFIILNVSFLKILGFTGLIDDFCFKFKI